MKNIFFIPIILALNSCANLSSLQDGRTLEKDEIEITPIVSLSKFNDTFNTSEYENDNKNYYLPTIGLRAKFGIVKNFDAGIVLDFSTNFGISSKYQFIGNSETKFNSSIGLDLGANIIAIPFDRNLYYYSVPLYLSYNPNNAFSFFIIPRFINNSDFINSSQYTREGFVDKYKKKRFSLTYGILFGKKNKFGIEISNNSNNLFLPTQLSLGYNIKL
ncbi:hypothetical protein [Flavobacterium sp.]|uniref:hypothetical protein n=1 Tax=Flavobacterium sp. TaxID=239 RepID=UPI0037524628